MEEKINFEEKIVYEIDQIDLVLAYNCLCYFTDTNATQLLNLLIKLNGKNTEKPLYKLLEENFKEDKSVNDQSKSSYDESYDESKSLKLKEIELNQLKFLFFITILSKIHLSYGNTFIYLPDFSNKKISLKISKITKFFEKFLILISDSHNISEDNIIEEKMTKEDLIENSIDENIKKIIEEGLVDDKNKAEKEFIYNFDDINSMKVIIEKINKKKNIFNIKGKNNSFLKASNLIFENNYFEKNIKEDDKGKNKENNKLENEEKNNIKKNKENNNNEGIGENENNEKKNDVENEIVSKNPPLFILETENKLYFRRFYLYESLISKNIIERINIKAKIKDSKEESKNSIKIYDFIDIFKNILDEKQINAIVNALENNLTVISGGPGTGKTYILSLIILAFISIYNYKSYQIIAVAPTGKAADRISESVNENISKFIRLIKDSGKNKDWADLNIDDIKIESITIHRLLKGSEMSLSFLHNRENKVKYKVVIVDEASMIDIPLMAKLLDALDEDTSLILSGDANQLSSVEAGRVFSDLKEFLYDIGEKQRSNIIELTKSFRYKEDSIVEKAKDILYKILNVKDDNEKDILADDFIRLLKEKQRILEQEVDIRLFENLSKKIVEFNETMFNDEIKNQLLLLRKLKFLSPLRLSKYGTYHINRMYARYLKTQGETGFIPIIITKNNYQLKLFNGDIGIIKKKDDDIYAYFEDEGKDSSLKEIALSLLSNWEPAYCLTVHKSQGSEFDTIVLFLPENVENFEFITLELLYTAITRAKEDFYIVSNHKSLKQVMLKRSKRFTGLYDKLKELII